MNFHKPICRCASPHKVRNVFDARPKIVKSTVVDPTGTMALQKKFQKELRLRWDAVRRQIPDAVSRNLDSHYSSTVNAIHGDQVTGFQSWLDQVMRHLVLGINGSWTLPYVRGAGDIGTQRANTLVNAMMVGDAFSEEDHPRDEHGQFTEGGGSNPITPEMQARIRPAIQQISTSKVFTGSRDEAHHQIAERVNLPFITGKNWDRASLHRERYGYNRGYYDPKTKKFTDDPNWDSVSLMTPTQRFRRFGTDANSIAPPVDRVPVMQSLTISELQGIMDAVSQQAVRAFASGLLGIKPVNKTVQAIQDIIDTTGKRRSDMLANFMCVRTFGTATLDHFRANGVNSVGTVPERIVSPSPIRDAKTKSGSRSPLREPGLVEDAKKKKKKKAVEEDLVEVLTAGDDDVCQECQDISDEGPYDLDDAESLIPAHPNCRCAFVPWDDERFAGVRDEFKEEDHPRDEKGKFAAGGGNEGDQPDWWATQSGVGGAPFKSMDVPKDNHGWAQVEGQDHGINEPPLPSLKQKPYTYSYTDKDSGEKITKTTQPADKRLSSGVIMREPDGRTWLVKPSKGFGGYNWTFPKGGVEEGLHPQANAIKEAYEESGLHAKITGYAGDYHGDTSVTRMYHAERIGGHPKDHHWETEQVALAHPDDVMNMLNRSRDKKIASHHILKDFIGDEFREEEHPRDDHGKFTYANAGSDPKFEAKIEKLKSGATKEGYNFSHFAGNYGPSDIGGMHALEVDNEHEIAVINAAAKHGIALNEHPEYSGSTFKLFTASHAVEAPKPAPPTHQLDMNELNKIGGKKGSNAGGTYEDKNGKQFYIKNPATTDHVQNELMAAKLYQLAGARTMDYVPVKGGAHVATELQNLDKNNISQFTDAEKKMAQKDFGVHAWLANWDAAGTGGDNQVIVGGKTHTVDVGGSLKYRAQGTAKKPEEFGNDVKDTKTLLDPSKNADAAKLYGSMTDAQKIASYQVVTSIPDKDIRKTVYAAGGNTEMADKLVARKADLFKQQKELEAQTSMAKSWESPPSEMAKEAATIAPKTPSITPHPDPTSKMGIIHHHLTKEGGTTSEELKKATGWPSIGIPKMASNLNLNLEKTKEGGVFKYKGTPMTPEQIAANKNAPKEAKAAPAAPPPPPEPPKTILGPSTAAAAPKYAPEIAKYFEPTPKHDINTAAGMFKQSLENKGVKFGEQETDNGHFLTVVNGNDVQTAMAVAKMHPKVEKLNAHEYYIPKEGTDLKPVANKPTTAKFEPGKPFITAAGFDINKPTGAFKQSLHEHGVDYQIGHGELYEHYTPNKGGDNKDMMAQIAKYHPAAIDNGDGSWSIKKESVQPAGATQAGVATPTAKSPEAIAQHFANTLEKSYGIKPISVAPFGPNSDLHGEHYVIVPKKDAATAASVAQMHPNIAEMPNPTAGNPIYHSVTKPPVPSIAELQKTVSFEPDPVNLSPTDKNLLGALAAVNKPPVTPPTDAELTKAKKNLPLQMQYVPGASGLENHPEAKNLLAAFNDKYAGKTLAEHELPAKVADFKQLAENMKPLMSEQQKAQAAAQAAQQQTQAQKYAQQKAEADAKAAAAKAEFEAKMNDPKVKAQYDALHSIGVGNNANLDKTYASDIAKLAAQGTHITGADAAYIVAYRGNNYKALNKNLWQQDKMSLQQSIYAHALQKALDKMPSYSGYAQRGVTTKGAFERYADNVGHVVTEHGFSSYGATHKLWGDEAVIHLQAKDLKDIRKFNPGEGGGELILQRGSLIHITKVNPKTKEVWAEQVG